MFTHLCIEYADASSKLESISLNYRLRSNTVVPKWIAKVQLAQEQYSIDDPARFYGFDSLEIQQQDALKRINKAIDVINSHETIVLRRPNAINDYDTLNYLHHIFEVYHGLLGQQTHAFYLSANDYVRRSLADLNICVHRCESVARGALPRHVVTYYGLPKTDQLEPEDYQLFTDQYQTGTVYLNYVEIGKTLEDLAVDNDHYIADEAFKPFRFYSADFCILFADSDTNQVIAKRELVKQYYTNNINFFRSKGLDLASPYLKLGRIPLADLDCNETDVLQLIKTRQFVKSVKFI